MNKLGPKPWIKIASLNEEEKLKLFVTFIDKMGGYKAAANVLKMAFAETSDKDISVTASLNCPNSECGISLRVDKFAKQARCPSCTTLFKVAAEEPIWPKDEEESWWEKPINLAIEDAKKKIAEFSKQLGDKAHDAKMDATDAANEMVENIQETLTKQRDLPFGLQDKKVERWLKKNKEGVKALAIAVGLGALLAGGQFMTMDKAVQNLENAVTQQLELAQKQKEQAEGMDYKSKPKPATEKPSDYRPGDTPKTLEQALERYKMHLRNRPQHAQRFDINEHTTWDDYVNSRTIDDLPESYKKGLE